MGFHRARGMCAADKNAINAAETSAAWFPRVPSTSMVKTSASANKARARPGDAVCGSRPTPSGTAKMVRCVRAVSALAASHLHRTRAVACLPYLWTGSTFALRCVFPRRRLTAGDQDGWTHPGAHVVWMVHGAPSRARGFASLMDCAVLRNLIVLEYTQNYAAFLWAPILAVLVTDGIRFAISEIFYIEFVDFEGN